MLVNAAHDAAECDREITAAIALPANDDMAQNRIRTFASYVRRIGDALVEGGGTKQSRPRASSVPFFLSYFWQIQDRQKWPLYFVNSVQAVRALNLWQPTENLAENYIEFKHLIEELADTFTTANGRNFDLYDVEFVFWFKFGPALAGKKGKK